MAAVLGYDARSITGRTGQKYLAIVHEQDREALLGCVANAVARARPFQVRYRARSASGSIRWLWEKGQPRVDPSAGGVAAVEGRVFDVTELLVDLESERTAAQHEATWHCLQQVARRLLSPSDDALTRGFRSHDGDAAPGTIAGSEPPWSVVNANLHALLTLAEERELQRSVVDLNAAVRFAVSILRADAKYAGFPRLSLARPLPHVAADAQELSQAVQTLALRAARASRSLDGVRLVTAAAECGHQPGGMCVTLEVSDDGRSIGARELERLFEPCEDDGTGVCDFQLARVRHSIQSMGGWVSAAAQSTGGLAINLYLPVASTLAAAPGVSRVRERQPPATPRGSVLVVDDTPLVRRAVAMTLQRAGFRVLTAGTSSEALARLVSEGSGIDVLVTDLVMPEGSGVELAQAVRHQLAHVRVLYVSGYPWDVASFGECPQEQGTFLQKPFAPGVLADAVARLVTAARGSR